MAPSQDSRENRPFVARASPSARDVRMRNGELLGSAEVTPAALIIFSSSPVPTTASTSGMFLRISSRKRSTRHPATINFFAPTDLWRAISRMVLTDSCCALSMKEQVFTTMTSASSARGTNSAPFCASMPIMTSLSTRFLGQPRLTNPTLGAVFGGWEANAGEDFEGMESIDFNIFIRVARQWASDTPKVQCERITLGTFGGVGTRLEF